MLQIAVLQAMKDEDKEELLRILKYIEDSLQTTWSQYSDYQELEERILRLRMILEDSPEGQTSSMCWLEAAYLHVYIFGENAKC